MHTGAPFFSASAEAERLARESQESEARNDRNKSCTLIRVLITITAIIGFCLVLQAVIRADQSSYAASADNSLESSAGAVATPESSLEV